MQANGQVQAMLAGKQRMAARCLEAADAIMREAGVTEVSYHEGGLRGQANPIKGRIRVPRPTTRRRLYIFAHECGHVALQHTGKKRPHRKEYEAELYASDALRRHGIAVPRKSLEEAKKYVAYRVYLSLKRGARSIDREALNWCKSYLSDQAARLLRERGLE